MALLKLWSLVVWSSVLVIHRFHTTGILVSAASDDTVYCFSSRDCVTGEFCEPGFGFCMPCSYICTGVGAARSSCVKFGCTVTAQNPSSENTDSSTTTNPLQTSDPTSSIKPPISDHVKGSFDPYKDLNTENTTAVSLIMYYTVITVIVVVLICVVIAIAYFIWWRRGKVDGILQRGKYGETGSSSSRMMLSKDEESGITIPNGHIPSDEESVGKPLITRSVSGSTCAHCCCLHQGQGQIMSLPVMRSYDHLRINCENQKQKSADALRKHLAGSPSVSAESV